MKPKKSHVRTHQIFALAHAWSKHIASSNTPQLCKPASDILKFQTLRLLLQFRYGQLSVHIFAHMEAIISLIVVIYLFIYFFFGENIFEYFLKGYVTCSGLY